MLDWKLSIWLPEFTNAIVPAVSTLLANVPAVSVFTDANEPAVSAPLAWVFVLNKFELKPNAIYHHSILNQSRVFYHLHLYKNKFWLSISIKVKNVTLRNILTYLALNLVLELLQQLRLMK